MEHAPQDPAVTSDVSTQFRLRSEAIRAAIDFKREHDPVFKGLTLCDLADKCRIGRSTFKRIVNGTTTDANCSTVSLICEGLGIDPAVVFGLAPSRDYQREAAEYNPTLMDNMRRQNIALEERIDEKRARIDELTAEVAESEKECDRLRKMYNEKCMALSAAEARIETLKNDAEESNARRARRDKTESEQRVDIEELKRTLYRERDEMRRVRQLGILMAIALFAALLVIIYLLWDANNPAAGIFRH